MGQGNIVSGISNLFSSGTHLASGAIGTLGTAAALYGARKLYNKKKKIQKQGLQNYVAEGINRLAD